jgi:hypothetical protein
MATSAVPTKAEPAMPCKSVPAERPKAVANVRRMVVEVAEAIKMIIVIDHGRAIEVRWTFIAETVATLGGVSGVRVVGVIVSWGGVRSLCRTSGSCERCTQYKRPDEGFTADHGRLRGPMPFQR